MFYIVLLKDAYSAFFENGHIHNTGLDQKLQSRGVKRLFVTGLASDYCVKWSSCDGASLNFEVYMVKDAARGIATDLGPTYKELEDCGVRVIETKDLPKYL